VLQFQRQFFERLFNFSGVHSAEKEPELALKRKQ
jgi:hypothetical protein